MGCLQLSPNEVEISARAASLSHILVCTQKLLFSGSLDASDASGNMEEVNKMITWEYFPPLHIDKFGF